MDRKSAVTSRLTVEEAQFITDGLVALPQHPADIINPDEQEVDEVKKDQLLADSNNTQGGVASPAYKIYIRDAPR